MSSLYRFYGADDVLLYVGITDVSTARVHAHASTQRWWDEVHRASFEHYPARKEAEAAEKAVIRAERPKYNIIHNGEPKVAGKRGRPEVGPATNVRLGEDLTAKVDAARQDGESRAAAIRRLLADALDPDLTGELVTFLVRYILRQRLKDHEPTNKELVAKLQYGAEGAELSDDQFAAIIAQAKRRADEKQASDPNWQDWCWR